jgi:hypothetical protein
VHGDVDLIAGLETGQIAQGGIENQARELPTLRSLLCGLKKIGDDVTDLSCIAFAINTSVVFCIDVFGRRRRGFARDKTRSPFPVICDLPP